MFRNRRVRRGFVGLVVGIVILVVGVFIHRSLTRRAGEKRYAEIVALLGATDPRWRFDEIDADRGLLPDDQNSVHLIPRFTAALARPRFSEDRHLGWDYLKTASPNAVLDDETYEALDAALVANDQALAVARKFNDYPKGLRRYALGPLGWLLPEVQETQSAVRLLDLAAERAGRDGRGGVALGYVRPMVNAARSLDGEPFLMSALVRISCLRTAAERVERTLALATPRGSLAEIQAQLSHEAETDLLWYALRGDRASMDLLFDRLDDGTLFFHTLEGYGSPTPGPEFLLTEWRYAPHLPADRATCLDLLTKGYEVRHLPEHQQRAAVDRIIGEIKKLDPDDLDSLLTCKLIPAFPKVFDASMRVRALLRCAAVGVAVERFRLALGRWPTTLDEIPKDILPAIPADPFDGKPLRYKKRVDGVTVYSIGLDEQDDGGNIPIGKATNEPGQDIGFRLYDPARRGLPAGPTNPIRIWLDTGEERNFDGAPLEPGPEPRKVGRK